MTGECRMDENFSRSRSNPIGPSGKSTFVQGKAAGVSFSGRLALVCALLTRFRLPFFTGAGFGLSGIFSRKTHFSY